MTTTMSVKSAPKDAKDQTMQAPDEKTFWRKMKGSVDGVKPKITNRKTKNNTF